MQKLQIKNKSGFTLLEVLLYISVLSSFTAILYSYNQRTTDEVKDINLVGDISKIANAIDRRIYLEGIEHSNWDKFEWNESEFGDFLRKELIASGNPECGLPDGWKPKHHLSLSNESRDKEINNYSSLLDKSEKSKLIPCSFWNNYPLKDLSPSIEIEKNNDIVGKFKLSLSFKNDAQWDESVIPMKKVVNAIRKNNLNTTMMKVDHKYILNNNEVDFSACMSGKSSCSHEITMDTNVSNELNDRLMINSTNSMKTNIKFANHTNDEESLKCEVWKVHKPTNYWSKVEVDCGLTGGSDGLDQFISAGNELDTQNVKLNINRDCTRYSDSGDKTSQLLESQEDCGILESGENDININLNLANSESKITNQFKTNILKTEMAYVKDNLDSEQIDIIGNKQKAQVEKVKKPHLDYIYSKDRITNSVKIAETSLTMEGDVNVSGELYIGSDLILDGDASLTTNSLNIRNHSAYNQLVMDGKPNVTEIETVTDSDLTNVFQRSTPNTGNSNVADTVFDVVEVKRNLNINKLIDTDVVVSTGVTKISNLNASNEFKTEQLHFLESMESRKDFNIARTINLDNVGSQYTYAPISAGEYIIDGWGSRFKSSDAGGLSASKISVNGLVKTEGTKSDRVNQFYKGFTVISKDRDHFRPLFDLGVNGFSVDTLGVKSFTTTPQQPILIGGVLLGDVNRFNAIETPENIKSNVSNILNDAKALRFNAVVNNSTLNIAANDDVTSIAGVIVVARNININTRSLVEIRDGLRINGPNSRPLRPNGSVKPLINLNDVGSNDKDYWIIKNGTTLAGMHHWSHQYLLDIKEQLQKYKILSGEIKHKKGDTGLTGVDGDKGDTGDRGSIGIQGKDGPVGDRGKGGEAKDEDEEDEEDDKLADKGNKND